MDKMYTTLVDLELERDDIRKKRNIIDYEKKARIQDDNTLSQDRVDKFRDELEICRITSNGTCKMAQPTQDGLDK